MPKVVKSFVKSCLGIRITTCCYSYKAINPMIQFGLEAFIVLTNIRCSLINPLLEGLSVAHKSMMLDLLKNRC